jgi:drug/metabolite transporter (DMT)-like permease
MMLADVTALAFSRMLFTTLLAALLLREAVTRGRWAATLAGFVGVMIVLRPGAAVIDQAALAALAAAVLFSFALIIVPKLATTEPPDRIVFYYNVLGAVLLVVPVAFVWQAPSAQDLAFLLAVGLSTSFSMVCFIRGFATGETSVVAPMEYVRLIYAAIIGYAFFAEVPDIWTVVGAAIIVASTLYIARRETRVRKTARRTAG